jgi:hypothetical protein
MSALTTHIVPNSEKERKRKKTNQKLKKVIKSQTKAKEDHLKEKVSVPLRQGQRLNTTETKCSKVVDSSR